MRVLICPDKFAGTLSAVEVAEAVAAGWRQVAPDDELVLRPVADGGPGFVEVLHAALGGRMIDVATVDPLGRPVTGIVLLTHDATGYLESAQTCGLHHLSADERDPKITTSYGLGALLAAAVEAGARRVVIGLGGSGTNDGGAGLFAALGAAPVDGAGYALPYGGAQLLTVAGLAGPPLLRAGVELIAATDVDNPLIGPHGAAAVYGPQKGATAADVTVLDQALARWSGVLVKDLPGCPAGLAALPGGGAAGGLGAALLALGGRMVSGIDLITELTGLRDALNGSDLVITGEGSFDHQSLRGKVIAGVSGAARQAGIGCVVLAGRISADQAEQAAAGVTEAYSLVDHFGSVEQAMAQPAQGLRELAARLATHQDRHNSV